jgi:hypothetical protein
VVDDAVDHRGGDDVIAEHISPAGERQVAAEDKRGVLVSGRDQLEEQVGCVLPASAAPASQWHADYGAG